MTEVERDGLVLINFIISLAKVLGALANHPVSNPLPPQLREALDDLVAALQCDAEALHRGLKSRCPSFGLQTLSVAKILAEVAATHQEFAAVLASQEAGWWTRRLHELEREPRAPAKIERVANGAG